MFKAVIFLLIIMILLSLSGGLFFLTKDRGRSRRTMYSLTLRMLLSVGLFILLAIGFFTGQLKPHGLVPAQTENIELISGAK